MNEHLHALHEKKLYRSDAIDGLDGSGKSSCGTPLARLLVQQGNNVVQLHLPHYSLPFGSTIGGALTEQGDSFTLEERFALYALNRLEVIGGVQRSVFEMSHNGNPTIVLWDRFWTSQFLTLAYGHSDQEITERTATRALHTYFSLIQRLDEYFIRDLILHDARVLVPMLDPQQAYDMVKTDSTRAFGSDKYETLDTQQLARLFYMAYADAYKNQMYIVDQTNADTGERYTPEEMANKLLAQMTWLQELPHGDRPGESKVLILESCPDPSTDDMERVIRMIGGSNKLYDLLNDFYSKAGNKEEI